MTFALPGDHLDRTTQAPDHQAPVAPGCGVPAPATPLIGRQAEIAALLDLLEQPHPRLITLLGVGGVGKTRLALECGARAGALFPDGVCFVSLEAFGDALLLPTIIGRALGIGGQGVEHNLRTLCTFLAPRAQLLILDNLEQIAVPAVAVLAALLAAAPALKLLVTSRVRLRMHGEHEVLVQPLACPDASAPPGCERLLDYDATRLLVARMQARDQAFAPHAEDAGTLEAICRAVDGLPLAIELVAARSRLFRPQELLELLRNALHLLDGGAYDLPERHRSLRRTLDWSWRLLTPAQRKLFRRLAIFKGDWTVAAAVAVGGEGGEPGTPAGDAAQFAVLRTLEELVDHGLVSASPAGAGERRWRMLRVIRAYASEQLHRSHELPELRRRHRAYFLALAEAAHAGLTVRPSLELFARLQAEDVQLIDALRFCHHDGAYAEAARLCIAIAPAWVKSGSLSLGREWCAKTLARRDALAPGLLGRLLLVAGQIATTQGLYEDARAWLAEALALSVDQGHELVQATTLELAALAMHEGRLAEANVLARRALDAAEAGGDAGERARATLCLGTVLLRQGDFAAARVMVDASLAAHSDPWLSARASNLQGFIAGAQGDFAAAEHVLAAAQAQFSALGDRRGMAQALGNQGELARARGDFAAAQTYFTDCLELATAIADHKIVVMVTGSLAQLAFEMGNIGGAARHFVRALDLARALGEPAEQASAHAGLSQVALAEGRLAEARASFTQSLALYEQIGERLALAALLEHGAQLALAEGAHTRAAIYCGAAAALRAQIAAPLLPGEQAAHAARLEELAAALGLSGLEGCLRAGQAIGAGPPALLARELAAAEQASVRQLVAAASGLSQREHEVLTLIARGMTNAEIASSLMISPPTVSSHVSAIFRKLGVRTRSAATRRAFEDKLI